MQFFRVNAAVLIASLFLLSLCRDALESVTSLYNQVEEKLHMLVMRSNESLQHLEVLLKIRETEAEVITVGFFKSAVKGGEMKSGFSGVTIDPYISAVVLQAGMWFSTDGEQRLKDFCTTDDTDIKKTFQDFSLFLALSKVLRSLKKTITYTVCG